MKRLFLLSIILISFLACEKNDGNSLSSKNIEDQEWYKKLKIPCVQNSVCNTMIIKALYNNDTVYYTQLSGPLCDFDFSATLLNNDGKVIKEYYGSNALTTFNNEVTYIKTTYKCY
jgi:hypothetical protein